MLEIVVCRQPPITHFDTPILPKVRVLDISGRMHALSFRCSGCRIQSSQNLNVRCQIVKRDSRNSKLQWTYAIGHFTDNSLHKSRDSIQPNPGKKSVRYNNSGPDSSMLPTFPLSFHADTHHRDESFFSSSCVARK